MNGTASGIEVEPGRAFDAAGTAETIVDVKSLRVASRVLHAHHRLRGCGRGLIRSIRIRGANRRSEQVARKIRKRETEEQRDGCAREPWMSLVEHVASAYVHPVGNASRWDARPGTDHRIEETTFDRVPSPSMVIVTSSPDSSVKEASGTIPVPVKR